MTDEPRAVISAGRRTFLKWATGLGSVCSVLLAGVPALRAFLSPAFRRKAEDEWLRVGEVAALAVGEPVKIDFVSEVKDAWVETRVLRNVWLYSGDGDKFTVYSGRCTHLGCSYGYDEKAKLFRCPCHNGLFDVKTGAVLGGPPPRPLDALDVKVQDGILYVRYEDFRLGVPQKVAV
ncbi:MAG TPA: Rieske (2Fe-2S) protein [Gemmatimonadales bacterium]|nr:Rieske (2Fe-2S) protein [Gemmatimonadales bacterium]